MSSELRYDGKVAVVTGAGNGLGRSHALLLASRGAKVVVNDLGGSFHGEGKGTGAADKVVAEIKAAGGQAAANYDSVENGDKIVQTALDVFGGVDIIVNNAGILRDVSFQKMTDQDWDLIYKVHVLGSYKVTKAAWNHMRDKGYGRIVMTASAAGIYGNFGQANYSMAKLGLHGFAQTLALEGAKKNVHVNTIAPIAGSRMTETVLPKDLVDALKPEFVSPLMAWLAHESCEENGGLFEVGGGFIGKLRWERTEGALFKLNQVLTPEKVQEKWTTIVDFGKSTHPTAVTGALSPIMDNLGSAKSKSNEFIDVDEALKAKFPETTSKYDERDLAIYALGVGAAHDPLDAKELQNVYELHTDGFRALPTFGVIPALNQIMEAAKNGGGMGTGLNFGFDRVLHGEQYLELKRPLPPKANLKHKTWIKDIFDKGKNALVVIAMRTYDEKGHELAYNELTMLVRGAGGFGGERGPSSEINVPPDRAPDAVVTEKISENQALLYRLSGDWNPLHADPDFAQAFGFKKPILHGLCTFGYAARHVIKSFSKGDPRYFKSIKTRFADSVFPGETLKTEMWKEGDKVIFRSKVVERDATVISNAAIELYKEIPAEPVDAPATAAAPAASAGPTSAAIFNAISTYVSQNPELIQKVATVYMWKLKDPASVWTLDLKNGKGEVRPGETKADCTLELTDADFMAMCTGKADPQKLFTTGKLKIAGNVMASQKLNFLKNLDPKLVTGGAPAPAAPVAAASGPNSTAIFSAISAYVAANADLVGKINTVYMWKLKDPASIWTMDLKNGKGEVKSGETKADCTLELTDTDFLAVCTGKADPQKLFTTGKLKISGNVMASQKLNFLKNLDPKTVADAMAKEPAPASASSNSSSKEPQANAIFEKLKGKLNAKLVGEIGAVLQFNVKDPEAAYVIDLKSGVGAIRSGLDAAATTTFELNDEDLGQLAQGKVTARDLYQHGQLKVNGDVRAAHKLGFFNLNA